MKTKFSFTKFLLTALFLLFSLSGFAQQNLFVNLAPIDGIDITPDNVLGFQVQSHLSRPINVQVKGILIYRGSPLKLAYSFQTTIQPGINTFNSQSNHPQWTSSSSALQDLFFNYKKLPTGTIEYCVSIQQAGPTGEQLGTDNTEECLYHNVEDIFLINLIDPENNAKIYEFNPLLSWVVNYPFASELTYRVRVAEIKQGQNPENAITRNQATYSESNLIQTSVVYPVYAKPLVINQPYAWTVDAYYKGLMLGGAEAWKFTIIEDSLLKGVPRDPAYIELNIEKGTSIAYAVGQLKLKYLENNQKNNNLYFTLTDNDNKEIKMTEQVWSVARGDNRKILQFENALELKHWKIYHLSVVTDDGSKYQISFRYVNPLFLN